MNEFTKEELLRMKNAIEYQSDLMHYPCQEIDVSNELSRKIQSMIENYCEQNDTCQHESDGEWVIVPYPERTPLEVVKYYKCKKCGEFYK